MDPLRIIIYAGILLALVPLTLGWKKRKSYLWLYVLAGFLSDSLISFVCRPLGYNKAIVSNTFSTVEFVLLTLYFREHLPTQYKRLATLFLLAGSLGFIAHTIYHSIYVLNGTAFGFLNLVYIVYSLIGMYTIMKEQKVKRLEQSEYFWANIAFIFYFAAGFLVFLFHDYLLVHDKATLVKLWVSIVVTNVILFRLMLIITLTRKEP